MLCDSTFVFAVVGTWIIYIFVLQPRFVGVTYATECPWFHIKKCCNKMNLPACYHALVHCWRKWWIRDDSILGGDTTYVIISNDMLPYWHGFEKRHGNILTSQVKTLWLWCHLATFELCDRFAQVIQWTCNSVAQ